MLGPHSISSSSSCPSAWASNASCKGACALLSWVYTQVTSYKQSMDVLDVHHAFPCWSSEKNGGCDSMILFSTVSFFTRSLHYWGYQVRLKMFQYRCDANSFSRAFQKLHVNSSYTSWDHLLLFKTTSHSRPTDSICPPWLLWPRLPKCKATHSRTELHPPVSSHWVPVGNRAWRGR